MNIKSKITALVMVVLMLFVQVPFTAFAEETDISDINANLLSPDTLPNGKVDIRYYKKFDFDYAKFDNFSQLSWHIVGGELPPGLDLEPSTGPTWQPWLTGTPTKAGTYKFTLQGAHSILKNGKTVLIISARKTYTLTILPYPLEISTNNLLNGNEKSSYWSKVYEDYGRTVTWSMTLADGSALPDGLSINSENGEINWEKPKVGKYNLKITAASTSKGESVSKVLKLIIEPGNGCPHTDAVKTERKHATCQESGMADYWYCDTCEGYLLDAEGSATTSKDKLDELYTTTYHSDNDADGKCDTCNKTMPIFRKVTSDNEITSCGMYLVVSKIGDKYYTFKNLNNLGSIDAVEITQNSDGTFSYPKSDTDFMILKTEFAAMCGGELDAGAQRYAFGTTINGLPYTFSSEDYSGSIEMRLNEDTKYGYRMKLKDDGSAAIASVYAEYWGGESGKGESNSSIMTAFEGKKDGVTKRFFSFTTKDSFENNGIYTGKEYYFYDTDSLKEYPVELYKLTYTGQAGDINYTLSDTQCDVTIDSEVTVLNDFGSKAASTAGGISEAVKTSFVETTISEQTDISGTISVTTYADINLTNADVTIGEYYTSINSLVYEVTPKIEIKGTGSEEPIVQVQTISNDKLDGSEITLTLCVGSMSPTQIIHYKKDGSREYFYEEHTKGLKPGQKTFSIDEWGTGNFVTFTVDSFSEFKILAVAKEEPITVGNATITAPVAGETPSFTAVSDDPTRYSVELLKWIDIENNMDIGFADLSNINSPYYNYKFEASKKYEVVVRFTAADDYELSYNNNFTINGEKTWWRGDGLIRTYTFVPNTDTIADKNENKFTVTGYNIDGCIVILALYKEDSEGNNRLVECQTAEYSGSEKTFTTTATDYTSAKVMVWKDLTTIKPVTEVEIVNLGEDD